MILLYYNCDGNDIGTDLFLSSAGAVSLLPARRKFLINSMQYTFIPWKDIRSCKVELEPELLARIFSSENTYIIFVWDLVKISQGTLLVKFLKSFKMSC